MFFPQIERLSWFASRVIVSTLGVSTDRFATKSDQKSTVRAFSESFARTSVSFRRTFEYVRDSVQKSTYVN